MKNVKIQIKDLFVHANMDTSEKNDYCVGK
jgi:hypothetical protein